MRIHLKEIFDYQDMIYSLTAEKQRLRISSNDHEDALKKCSMES